MDSRKTSNMEVKMTLFEYINQLNKEYLQINEIDPYEQNKIREHDEIRAGKVMIVPCRHKEDKDEM